MKKTEFDRDEVLSNILTDYLDGTLNGSERKAFEAYLDKNPLEKEFAQKAMRGRKRLGRLASKVKASENFEAKLSLKLHLMKKGENIPQEV